MTQEKVKYWHIIHKPTNTVVIWNVRGFECPILFCYKKQAILFLKEVCPEKGFNWKDYDIKNTYITF